MPGILLVDDEPDILQALEELVAMEIPGIKVRMAPDGPTALKLVEEERPDVILSDFRMPKMDGLQFLREVRDRFGGIPAVLLTAFPDRRLAVEAAQEGIIRRFYIKPPDVDQVMNGLRELLDPASVKA